MGFGMITFLSHLPPDHPIGRGAWTKIKLSSPT